MKAESKVAAATVQAMSQQDTDLSSPQSQSSCLGTFFGIGYVQPVKGIKVKQCSSVTIELLKTQENTICNSMKQKAEVPALAANVEIKLNEEGAVTGPLGVESQEQGGPVCQPKLYPHLPLSAPLSSSELTLHPKKMLLWMKKMSNLSLKKENLLNPLFLHNQKWRS